MKLHERKAVRTLQETLNDCPDGDKATVIKIPMKAEQIILLTTDTRGFAFLMWERILHTPRSLVTLKTKTSYGYETQSKEYPKAKPNQYSVVCPCVPIGAFGLTMPDNDFLDQDEWEWLMTHRFMETLQLTCQENHICSLLVHHADSWRIFRLSEYSQGRLNLYEASSAIEYQRYLPHMFPFIDWKSNFFNPKSSD
jgi:hypothetical protein